MQWISTALLALAALAPVDAMLRFSCSQLVVERIDPLVSPGSAQVGHLHQVCPKLTTELQPRIPLTCTGRLLEEMLSAL